jgi:hypothetical protein
LVGSRHYSIYKVARRRRGGNLAFDDYWQINGEREQPRYWVHVTLSMGLIIDIKKEKDQTIKKLRV